jgi:hypothetical protein
LFRCFHPHRRLPGFPNGKPTIHTPTHPSRQDKSWCLFQVEDTDARCMS